MNRRTFCAILPVAGALRPAEAASRQQPPRERLLFDHDWRFLLGDPSGAESPSYDAAGWRTVDMPHDWSIEGKIDPKNPMGGSGGFFPAGVGWYRRTFTVPAAWSAKRVSVEFEGVYMNATVVYQRPRAGHAPLRIYELLPRSYAAPASPARTTCWPSGWINPSSETPAGTPVPASIATSG